MHGVTSVSSSDLRAAYCRETQEGSWMSALKLAQDVSRLLRSSPSKFVQSSVKMTLLAAPDAKVLCKDHGVLTADTRSFEYV